MFRTLFLVVTSVAMMSSTAILAPTITLGQEAACSSIGPFSINNAYNGPAEGLARPARNTAAAIAVQGNRSNCTYKVICVSADNEKPSFENAKIRCKTVREVLVANLGSTKRTAVKTSIELITKRPRDGFSPASVHITAVPRSSSPM